MFEVADMIKKEILNMNNKKVKEENLNEFLTSFKNEELTRFTMAQIFIDEDYGNLFKVHSLGNRPKKYIVEYIINSLDKILDSYIKIIRTVEIKQLKLVLEYNKKKMEFGKLPISINLVNFLRSFSIAKIEYNESEDSLKFFMPEEYIEIFKKSLDNKKLLEINNYNNKVFEYARALVDTYGVIPIDKLHEIFEQQIFKIDKQKLQHIITIICMYEDYHIYGYNGEMFFCNLEFESEDDALDFYDAQIMTYKKYSKEDYKKIADGVYVEGLKSYKKFINYLCRNYTGISQGIEDIKNFIVNDFISFAQISMEDAERAFRTNIIKILDANEQEVEELLILMKNIFKEYPKWIKSGNV